MNKMLLPESLLKEAVIKACERENTTFDKLVATEDDPVFSNEFKKNIKKLTKEKQKAKKADIVKYPLKRVPKKSLRIKIALIAIILMMFGSMTVIAVEPFREKVYKIVEKLFPDHTDISFEEVSKETADDNTDSQIKSFNPADFPKKLKWVPEGFELYSEDVDPNLFTVDQTFTYTNSQYKTQQILSFEQIPMEGFSGWGLTSDGTPAEEIVVCGITGQLISDEYGGHSIVLTKDGFAYCIFGDVSVETLIKCLESTFANE